MWWILFLKEMILSVLVSELVIAFGISVEWLWRNLSLICSKHHSILVGTISRTLLVFSLWTRNQNLIGEHKFPVHHLMSGKSRMGILGYIFQYTWFSGEPTQLGPSNSQFFLLLLFSGSELFCSFAWRGTKVLLCNLHSMLHFINEPFRECLRLSVTEYDIPERNYITSLTLVLQNEWNRHTCTGITKFVLWFRHDL